MRQLLYLKDKELKEYILNVFYAYRNSFDDIKKVSREYSLGIPHCKALLIISISKGISVSELLRKLRVTKQSLNRVLRDLIKSKMIRQVQDESDTRKKNLFLDKEGKVFFDAVYNSQKKRIFNALKSSSSDSVIKFKDVLKKIIDGK